MVILLQESGVTHIWLPPPSQSVADQGYLPGQLYNLDSKYGNKEELQALCKELKAAGIMPLADIVINHRCADEKGEDGVYNTFRSTATQLAMLLGSLVLSDSWIRGAQQLSAPNLCCNGFNLAAQMGIQPHTLAKQRSLLTLQG